MNNPRLTYQILDYGNSKGMVKKGWTLSSGVCVIILDFLIIDVLIAYEIYLVQKLYLKVDG